MSDFYKVIQVANVFIEKYNFIQIVLQDYRSFNNSELWLRNEDDPNISLIRITTNSIDSIVFDKNRINDYLKFFNCNKDNFLDIHISSENYNPDYKDYNYINLDENFASGYNAFNYYPNIYVCVHTVEDKETEYKQLLAVKNKLLIEKVNKKLNINESKPIVTYILIGICVILFLIRLILSFNHPEVVVDIVMGANYHTFTIGLRQIYRLFTSALLHGSYAHLITNMYSLYVLGRYIENSYGKVNYIFMLLVSIFMGSISQLFFSQNGVSVGLSGGLYGLMLVFIIDLIISKRASITSFLPLILINVSINFMNNVAWIAHLGGLVGGYLVYSLINSENKRNLSLLYIILLILIIIKFFSIKKISPFYQGSDLQVINLYNDIGLKNYATKLFERLYMVYIKFGG